ncbi:MAG: methyltransferase domain-containing protein [Spirochaetes bacterium]|nr:methyltransferase domain-containing protein [Spirochaetota bacterium]
MDRLADIVSFIERDVRDGIVIEPAKRLQKLREGILDVVETYKPGTIVKAGLGRGELLLDIAGKSTAYIAVVEPSMALIHSFIDAHTDDPALERIRFINGEFNALPVDYYSADLLVCVDYLEFLESGRVLDEFRRILQFDGILFLGGIVLEDEDIEGIYDDFMKAAFPLHNDYYLRDDLKTMLALKDFTFIKGSIERFGTDLAALAAYFASTFGEPPNPPPILEDRREDFTRLYGLDGTAIAEPYYISIFMREKPKTA